MLMAHFFTGSEDYNGDIGQVQVALRKDSNPRQASRIRLLAQQVLHHRLILYLKTIVGISNGQSEIR